MTTFNGHLDDSWTTPASPQQALDFFADLDRIEAHSDEMDRAERLGDNTLQVVLKEQRAGRTKYTGRYTIRWTADPDHGRLRWETLPEKDGNMIIQGEARFEPDGAGGTRIHWRESLEAEVPINRIVAKAVRPVADRLMERGMRGYVERMLADLADLA